MIDRILLQFRAFAGGKDQLSSLPVVELISTGTKLYPVVKWPLCHRTILLFCRPLRAVGRYKAPRVRNAAIFSIRRGIQLWFGLGRMDCATTRDCDDVTRGMKPGRSGLCDDAASQERQLARTSCGHLVCAHLDNNVNDYRRNVLEHMSKEALRLDSSPLGRGAV